MDEKKKQKGRKRRVLFGYIDRLMEDHIGAYAAEAAYFLMMSFIPFVLFLFTIVQYTPLTYQIVRDAILSVVPENLQKYVLGIVAHIYSTNGAMVPITVLTTLWSAGKGVQAISNGLNVLYHVKETRSWLLNRVYSILWTILFVVTLVGCLFMLILGNQIQILVAEYIPFMGRIIRRILDQRSLTLFLVLFLVFDLLYKVLPNRKATFRSQIPGALFSAVSWLLLSDFISMYFVLFPGFTNMYGNMAMILLVMLWLDFCMILMLCGAEINAYFENDFRKAKHSVDEYIDHHKHNKIQS